MASPDKSIGRVFIEAGVDLSQLNKGFDQIVKSITDVDGKVAAYAKRLASNFEAAYNPTQKLGKQLEALAAQGKTAGELIAVFGDRIQKTMETVGRTGAEPSKIVANLAAQMKIMNQATEGAGSGIARLGQAMTDFARNPLAATQAGISSILEKMGPLAVGIGGVVAAIGLAAYEFGKFMVSVSDEVEALENLSTQTGVSTQRLQALQQMQREAGLTGMDLGRIIAQLNMQLGKGEGEFIKTVKAMGIALKDSNGEMRDAFDILSDFGVALKSIQNPAEQVAVGMAALGPRAREFVALLVRTQGSLKDVAEQMQSEGIGFTEQGKKQFDQLDSALDRLDRKFQSIKTSMKEAAGSLLGNVSAFQVFLAAPLPQTVPQMGPPLPPNYYRERIKEQEEFDKKQKQSQKDVEAAQKKINDAIVVSMELQQKLNNETKLYATFVDAAAKIWKAEVLPTIKEVEDGAKRFDKALEDLGEMKIHPVIQPIGEGGQSFEDIWKDAPKVVKPILDDMEKANKKTAENIGDIWRNQVSTIVTDWGRGLTDMIFSGENFAEKLKNIFLDTAKSIVRMMVEQLFKPLMNWIGGVLNSLFGMGKSGAAGTATAGGIGGLAAFGGSAGLTIGGALAGLMIPKSTPGKVLGGIAGGTAGLFAAGGISALASGASAGGIAGFMSGGMMALAAVPVWGWAALGAAAIGAILVKIFSKDAFEAGAMEATRDLGGISIGEKTIKSFFSGLGLSEKQAYPIRKDLLSSPAFLTQIAYPAAQAQGKTEQFLASLEKISTSWGTFNLRDPFEQWVKTGSAETLNKAFTDIFNTSAKLREVMPDFASVLAATGTAMSDVADATDDATTGFTALKDAIVASMPATKDMFQTFWDTGEILPELADLITKFGGNLAVFQKAGDFGQLRANLAGISELISGLGDILPELSPIEKLLSGGGIDWTGLKALNIDPSKLIPIADLLTFENRWEDSVKQFQDTGKLLSGSALQQALWKFGGTAGATALSSWDQGFNTITPGLLDMTKSAMDAAYQAERQTAMDYLTGIQSTMESEIQTASDAIVAELELILAAIESGKTATAAPTPESLTAQGGAYIDLRGATVYGYEDFESKVQTAWNTAYRRKAFDYAIP